jgi:hypothetical protein
MFQIGGVPDLCRKRLACGCRVLCTLSNLPAELEETVCLETVHLEMINGVVF